LRILKVVIGALLAVIVASVGFVYSFPEKATQLAIDSARDRAGLVRKEIVLPDGLRYVYLEGGQGEPLLLLHGFGANKDSFTTVARFLTPHYRVVMPDQVGFGESAHPPQADYSPPAQARRLHALIQALGFKTIHVGGNSMGGQIAMTYAALFPMEVSSLWLLDPAGVWSAPRSEVGKIIAETGRNPLVVKSEDDFAALVALLMNKPPFIPGFMAEVMARERIANYDLELRIFRQIAADSVERRVSGLGTPTLIVWGDRDRLLNVASAEVLRKLMPNSRVIVMHEVGHIPMIERPRESAADYLTFRASLPGATAATSIR